MQHYTPPEYPPSPEGVELSSVEQWVGSKLRGRRPGKRSMRVIRTIAGSPEFASTATVAQLAQRVGVDPATVVRSAKILGCNGWNGLQEELRGLVRADPHEYGLESAPSAPWRSSFEAALESDLIAMKNLRHALSEEACRRFVDALLHRQEDIEGDRPRIYLHGTGSQVGPLTQFAHVCARLGLTAEPVGWGGRAPHTTLSSAAAGDVLLLLSFWRTPAESEVVAQVAKHRGLRILVVTDTHFSQLTPYADDMLVISADGPSHFPSMVGLSSLIHVLLVLITEQLGETGSAAIRTHDEIYFALEEARAKRGTGRS